jgi:hypothetical protein
LTIRIPFAEERAQSLEGDRHGAAEHRERDEGRQRQPPVQVEQNAERDDRGDDAADELHEAGADEVPDAFGVAHDARNQDAGLRRVEISDRQARDVRLDAAAHVGDGALGGHAEHLRNREGGDRLDDRRGAGDQRERQQQIRLVPADDVVYQVLRRRRQHHADEPVDEHQREAEREPASAGQDELARLAPGGGRGDFLLWRLRSG